MSEPNREPKRYRLGFDVGGTFTDFVLYDDQDGSVRTAKVLTVPDDPADGVIQGLRKIQAEFGIAMKDVQNAVHHGTTLIINALIERKGARTGLITTRGFRDVLEFQREFRYDIYDLNILFAAPLVPRHLRREVQERSTYDGTVLTPLDRNEVEKVVEELLEERVGAIAVSLLHAYANPAHERAIGDIIRRRAPALVLSLSSDILSELREYERTVLAVMNAYVQPIARRYLSHLHARLRDEGFRDVWHVMASNGGVLTVETAATYPVRTLESGPVGGALAAAHCGAEAGFNDLLAFDMGGTTAKSCVIKNGRMSITTDYEVARARRFKKGSGLPVKLPVVDMIEIGAGGGSIARLDDLGLITVGPESAGADPGPACYGFGGQEPTVTDADLVLGYFSPDYFLGGQMRLEKEASLRAMKKIADPLAMTPSEAAWGIYEIVNTNMAEAARTHIVERGVDVLTLAMFAYGGAGPAHAYRVASMLKIPRVIFPPGAGVLSALGFLTAPLSFDFVRSHVQGLERLDVDLVNGIYAELTAEVTSLLREAGVPEERITIIRTADMRYAGQGFEVNIPIPDRALTGEDRNALSRTFHEVYREKYGRMVDGVPVESVNWRLLAHGPRPSIQIKREAQGHLGDPAKGEREAYFGDQGRLVPCKVYDRYKLQPRMRLAGPALVEERECTIVIGPDCLAEVDDHLNLILSFRGGLKD